MPNCPHKYIADGRNNNAYLVVKVIMANNGNAYNSTFGQQEYKFSLYIWQRWSPYFTSVLQDNLCFMKVVHYNMLHATYWLLL